MMREYRVKVKWLLEGHTYVHVLASDESDAEQEAREAFHDLYLDTSDYEPTDCQIADYEVEEV